MMVKIFGLTTIIALCLCVTANDSQAYTVSPQAAYAALGSAPDVLDATRSLAAIPSAASNLLYLPMALAEMILSPLPSITMGGAMSDLGRGLMAPFQVVMVAMQVPFQLLGSLSKIPSEVVMGFLP
jgi:hypothetical protein